jgi:hypothetical protein
MWTKLYLEDVEEQASSKRWYPPAKLHGITFQKTVILILIAIRTSHLPL